MLAADGSQEKGRRGLFARSVIAVILVVLVALGIVLLLAALIAGTDG
jgi:hypothetical protein